MLLVSRIRSGGDCTERREFLQTHVAIAGGMKVKDNSVHVQRWWLPRSGVDRQSVCFIGLVFVAAT